MAKSKVPLLGSAEILDLQGHVKAKAQRELLARLVNERNRALDMVEQMGQSLVAISEVLAECRDNLQRAEGLEQGLTDGPDLIAKITELLGDG